MGHHMGHVGSDHRAPMFMRRACQQFRAACAGGELRAQIGQVAPRIARRMRALGQHVAHGFLAKGAFIHHQQIVDQHAFIGDGAAVGRHGTGRDPADIGMVAAGSDEGIGLVACVGIKHRHDHGDIGQVRSAAKGIIEHIGIAAPEPASIPCACPRFDHASDGVSHAAKMHRDMRRIGDQRACCIKQRAGKIQPFLDIDRCGGGLQHHAHFFGNRHEQVVENLQPHRIGCGAGGAFAGQGHGAGQDQAAFVGKVRLPAGFDHGGGTGVDNQQRAGLALAFAHCAASDGGPAARSLALHRHGIGGSGAESARLPACLYTQRLDDDVRVRPGIAVTLAVERAKGRLHRLRRLAGDGEQAVAPGKAQAGIGRDGNGLLSNALSAQHRPRLCLQRGERLGKPLTQRLHQTDFADRLDRGKADAEG